MKRGKQFGAGFAKKPIRCQVSFAVHQCGTINQVYPYTRNRWGKTNEKAFTQIIPCSRRANGDNSNSRQ